MRKDNSERIRQTFRAFGCFFVFYNNFTIHRFTAHATVATIEFVKDVTHETNIKYSHEINP